MSGSSSSSNQGWYKWKSFISYILKSMLDRLKYWWSQYHLLVDYL